MSSHLYEHELIKFSINSSASLPPLRSHSPPKPSPYLLFQPIFPTTLQPIYPLKMQSNQFLASSPAQRLSSSSNSSSIQIEIFLLPLALLLLLIFHSISSKYTQANLILSNSNKPKKLSNKSKPSSAPISLNHLISNPDSITKPTNPTNPFQALPSSPSSN